MTRASSPLGIEDRRRFVERCRIRPIAHIAAETGVSRVQSSSDTVRYCCPDGMCTGKDRSPLEVTR
ncbi:hypothetical protein QF034_008149 [Streptomyces africanus]|uniref:Transposase n=1 Tax=Streptomyces africanus TaxID=231024 RepID=A0ABU0R2M8_9ACTN|nr:hypothetical protein [Streptomyces africanus]